MNPIAESASGVPLIGAPLIGQPLNRTDGHAKVTGAAIYAAEHALPGLLHAVIVTSTIAHGRIANLDTGNAERMRGVRLVMSHHNAPALPEKGRAGAGNPPAGRVLNLLQDDQVLYNNQPVAIVVAETLEQAQDAARTVRITYDAEAAVLDFELARPTS